MHDEDLTPEQLEQRLTAERALDEAARERAAWDQSAEGMRELGRGVAGFYRGLCEGGLGPVDALEVVVEYVRALAARVTSEDDDE